MNKTAIKNFAIWARNKLIADITYKAGLLGITDKEVKHPLPQSTKDVQFFDIGTKEPYSISGEELKQRDKLVEIIRSKSIQSDYSTAYKSVVEEVAYTWFNRLIAIRFMEVNDYLPSRIRVLSSESRAKIEPDLVTKPFETDLVFTSFERDQIIKITHEAKLDELFRLLFIKQCNALNEILPNLFEKTNNYTELLLNVSFTDKEGVLYHLVHDIDEDDFNVEKEGQVEIIGWLYQYYNTELKDEAFGLLKQNVKITKESLPAVTQLFTPDWIVRYMIENSLGRLWLDGHPNDCLKSEWKYYLDEAEQEVDVKKQLESIREEYKTLKPEHIKLIDPCMGSGHILVYAFDVLMQIYESYGYSQRDAAKNIIENNLYGLDIDNRAYQLSYFAVMMKARQYNRRILNGETTCRLYAIQESNGINRKQLNCFGAGMSEVEKNGAMLQIEGLLDTFIDGKEYGSILDVDNYNWKLLYRFINSVEFSGQLSFDVVGLEDTKERLRLLVEVGEVMTRKYDVVVTNPPYMGSSGMSAKLMEFVKTHYQNSKADLFACFINKSLRMTRENGYTSMITMHSWMFLSTFDKLREDIVKGKRIIGILHLGMEAFDDIIGKVVSTAAFVLSSRVLIPNKMKAVRVVDFYDSRRYLKKTEFFKIDNRYISRQDDFMKIPGMPIAYWLSEKMLEAFQNKKIGDIAKPRQGLATGCNDNFIRLWYEVSDERICFNAKSTEEAMLTNQKWFPYNKGGEFRKWFGNNDFIVNWENDGILIKNFKDDKGKLRSRPQNTQFYFKECISWSLVSSITMGFRYKDYGNIFDVAGMSCFAEENLLYLLALCNSPVAKEILAVLAPTINYQAGDIANIPVIVDTNQKGTIDHLVGDNISISKTDWNSFETSWDFITHPLITYRMGYGDVNVSFENCQYRIADAFIRWQDNTESQFNILKSNEEELNKIFIDIYDIMFT